MKHPIQYWKRMHKRSHRHAKIYLLDAHPVVRMGLTHLIQNESTYKIVGESGDSVSALKDLSALQADILIMGLHLHAMNDLEFIKSLKSEIVHRVKMKTHDQNV